MGPASSNANKILRTELTVVLDVIPGTTCGFIDGVSLVDRTHDDQQTMCQKRSVVILI